MPTLTQRDFQKAAALEARAVRDLGGRAPAALALVLGSLAARFGLPLDVVVAAVGAAHEAQGKAA